MRRLIIVLLASLPALAGADPAILGSANRLLQAQQPAHIFAGKDATHIGLTYSASVQGFITNPAIREVQGAAAFKRP